MENFFNESKILINGEWIGIHKDPINLVNVLVSLKRQAIINPYTSISFNTDMNEVNVFTDAGRCSRPLYIVENRALKITKHHINLLKSKMIKFKNLILDSSIPSKNHTDDCGITEGVIEYVDTEESWYSMIAMNQETKGQKHYI